MSIPIAFRLFLVLTSIGKPRVSPLFSLNTSAVIRYLICVYASHFFTGRPYHFNQTLRTANKFLNGDNRWLYIVCFENYWSLMKVRNQPTGHTMPRKTQHNMCWTPLSAIRLFILHYEGTLNERSSVFMITRNDSTPGIIYRKILIISKSSTYNYLRGNTKLLIDLMDRFFLKKGHCSVK
jgi:hypothetical protein